MSKLQKTTDEVPVISQTVRVEVMRGSNLERDIQWLLMPLPCVTSCCAIRPQNTGI